MASHSKLFNKKIATTVAKALLDRKAITINLKKPYKWASGWTSPIYCDNRTLLSYVNERQMITNSLVSLIISEFKNIDGIIGVATAGIPQGILVAEQLRLPFLYVRSSAKQHGTGKLIEGVLNSNHSYVMIEDLISTGSSSLNAAKAITDTGAKVCAIVSIFTYGFPTSEQAFENANIPLYYLSNYNIVIEELNTRYNLSKKEIESLEMWREKPDVWNL